MIFLVLSREGYKDISRLALDSENSVRVNGGVLSSGDVAEVRAKKVDVTTFSARIVPTDTQKINDAIYTVSEHHAGEKVWVEFQNPE